MATTHVQLKPDFFIRQQRKEGWSEQCLPQIQGKNLFQSARICPEIQLTRSHCQLDQAYECQIEHPQPTTLLLFGEAGISYFAIGEQGDYCTVRPGDLWLINLQGSELKRLTPPDQTCRLQVLKMDSQRINHTLGDNLNLNQLGTRAIRVARQSNQPSALQKLLKNPLNSPVERLLAEAYALEVMAHSLGPLLSGSDMISAPTSSPTVKNPQLQRVMERLTADLASPPSLDDLAQESGMSHARLNREFKKSYGETVFSWLRKYRMQQACEYLKHGQQDITDIAILLGFSSASHFATSFRNQFGCTPLQYRLR